jgi:peptidoglycan/xylan/chitin deacetylase (PgdA/CDA1 family)
MTTMPALLSIVWDYDTAIGQVNASYPYKFREETILAEIALVDTILDIAREHSLRMTFAVVGFAAEQGHYPYHVPDQIKRISAEGHEIASHSWRHEWFPHLEDEQIRRSLTRSKSILEECMDNGRIVCGFVPPFSRPMSWYRKGSVSRGDNAIGSGHSGGNIGSLLQILRSIGYEWCRVSYRPVWRKIAEDYLRRSPAFHRFETHAGITTVPLHYTGFDEGARALVAKGATQNSRMVINGHPAGLGRPRSEHLDHLKEFVRLVTSLREKGALDIVTVEEACHSIQEKP